MTETPTLTPEALAGELKYVHRKPHRVLDTVLIARMSPALAFVDVELQGEKKRFRVESARCELELRAVLADAAATYPAVVLIDWVPGTLAADLMGRVATGAAQPIARSRRIRAAFSNAQVSEELLACRPLVDAIVNDASFRRPQPPGGLVTLDAAWRQWLLARGVWGLESETEATFLARAAREPAPPGLATLLSQSPELRERLEDWLKSAVGQVAPWILRLWLEGKGLAAAALAFVVDATRPSLGSQDFVDGSLSSKLAELSPALRQHVTQAPQLLERWAELASMLATQFENDTAALLRVVDAADRFLPSHPATTAALARSDYLRTAFDARKQTLAEAFNRAADAATDETTRAIRIAIDALGRHRLRDADPGPRELFERAVMAARLVAWLAARSRDVPFSASENIVTVLNERAEDYVRNGAFADFARRTARGSTADALGAAIQRVVERADVRRDEDDAEFARVAIAWSELGRTPDRVLPIEAALDRFATRFLQGDTNRKLLIVLLDGMAWANAIELLESLEGIHYAPLRWRGHGTDSAGVPPVIAGLPTITDVSRAALFAGQPVRATEALDSSRDPVRFENHRTLRALGGKPKLLLKSRLQTTSGDASNEALDLVSSADRVVAVVINAIDDQLKAGRQTRLPYTLKTIRPLQDLLDRATLANRAVLLVADHGHIQGARMTNTLRTRGEDQGGARWRSLRGDAKLGEGEVAASGPYVWRPAGADRVAMLVRETDSYGLGTSEGEHGGASLAEAIAPAILVGSESLAARMQNATSSDRLDPELEVRALVHPAWWDLRATPAAVVPSTPVPTQAKPRKEPEPVRAQIPLAGVVSEPALPAARPAPKALARVEASAWETFFARSKTLKDVGRTFDTRFVAIVAALAAENGVLAADRLAQMTGHPGFRIEGFVYSMGEVLNAGGTEIIRYESASRLVHLDLAALREIFG